MERERLLEMAFVVTLFAGYLGLWRWKRWSQQQRTGVDPEVLGRATTPVQVYFARLLWVFTCLVVAVIGLHAFAPVDWPPLVRLTAFRGLAVDLAGFGLGLGGLAVCALAQAAMGMSWRVGIDAERRTDLITGGIFGHIRNPTYLGLHLVNLGLWAIWPTTLAAGYAVIFFVVMDIQVRAEEEHLANAHGETYRAYVCRSWRYLPWIY